MLEQRTCTHCVLTRLIVPWLGLSVQLHELVVYHDVVVNLCFLISVNCTSLLVDLSC